MGNTYSKSELFGIAKRQWGSSLLLFNIRISNWGWDFGGKGLIHTQWAEEDLESVEFEIRSESGSVP